MDLSLIVMLSVAGLVGFIVLLMIARQFLHICRPNELMIVAGRRSKLPGGQQLGYTVYDGGWVVINPFIEKIHRMSLMTMEVEVNTRNAFCKGGIRLDVDAIANVKISGDPRIQGNAIERFMGHPRHEVAEVAKQTLEGHLRAVVAGLTPEEVNEDRLKFAHSLTLEAEADLNKLGIHLDTFNIHSVADISGSSYLRELSRKVIADVMKRAEVAEAEAERDATEVEAEARSLADVAKENADAQIRIKANELAKLKADLEARAKSVEEEAEAARDTARARAEQELQEVRAQLEDKRLKAEVVIKADAEARGQALLARGEAAPVAERGKAMAQALDMVRQAWMGAGDGAKTIFMVQQIDTILREVVDRIDDIEVGEVSLVDRGDGSSLPRYVASFPATVNAVLRELDHVIGIDVVGTLGHPAADAGGNGHAASARAQVQGGAS